MNSARMQV